MEHLCTQVKLLKNYLTQILHKTGTGTLVLLWHSVKQKWIKTGEHLNKYLMQLVLNNHQFTNHHEMCQSNNNQHDKMAMSRPQQAGRCTGQTQATHQQLHMIHYRKMKWNNVTHKCLSMWNSQRVDEMMTVIENEIDWDWNHWECCVWVCEWRMKEAMLPRCCSRLASSHLNLPRSRHYNRRQFSTSVIQSTAFNAVMHLHSA